MSERDERLGAYAEVLAAYVNGAGETALARAYELGRGALVDAVSVTDLATLHHEALVPLLRSNPGEDTIARAGEVLSELLAPFEMTQRGFRHANAALTSLNEELEAFSYSVAHDLRAPLRAIDGFGRALQEDSAPLLDEAGRGHLEQIRTSTDRMARLIDDLLRLSRIGRSELRKEAVDVTALARVVCGTLDQAHVPRKVDWQVQDGMAGEGDLALLRIAFENLLGNAWKFTARRETPSVRCRAETVDQHLVYTVEDNGAGFDPAHADRLFSPFHRLHPTTDFEGTGIGLAIVQRVIRRHGGDIWAEGKVEAGARFHFTLDWRR